MKKPLFFLKAWREVKGLSQNSLAEKAGLTQAAISNIENGRQDPTLSTLGRLAESLEITPAELLSRPPQFSRKLSRQEIDRIARLVVSDKRGDDPFENRVADVVAALVIKKLQAHRVPGARRNRGKRWNVAGRSLVVRQIYPELLLRQILLRLDRLLARPS